MPVMILDMVPVTGWVLQQCFMCLGLLLQGVLLAEISNPPEGFKFNCGDAICVFPRHFCNVVGKPQCNVCTLHVCNELNVSSQCGQRCKELRGEVEISTTEGPPEDLWSTLKGQVTTLTYVVGTLVALLVLYIVVRVVKHVIACRKRTGDKSTDGSSIPQRYTYQDLGSQDDEADVGSDPVTPTAPPDHLDMSRPVGSRSSVSVYQPSPSGLAGNHSERGNYTLLPETIPESSVDPRPKMDIRQQHPVADHNVSDMGDFHLLDGASLATSTSDDPDFTVVKNNNLYNSSDVTEVVPDDIDRQTPLSTTPSVNSCHGMSAAYTNCSNLPKVSSDKSIISSTSNASDSGNYSSSSSGETDNIAKGKRRYVNEDNTLTANV